MIKQYTLPVEKKEQKISYPLMGCKGTFSCELLEARSFLDRRYF